MADLREARLLETDAALKIVDYMEGVVEKLPKPSQKRPRMTPRKWIGLPASPCIPTHRQVLRKTLTQHHQLPRRTATARLRNLPQRSTSQPQLQSPYVSSLTTHQH
jgi:hypothetical protein